jgi:hypothetical protein
MMSVQVLSLAVLGALLPGTMAACSDYTDCGTCLTEVSLEEGCFWCYGDETCKTVGVGGTPPAISFGGCAAENVTFDSVNCECRPNQYTSCSQCATASHPSCVWIEEGFEGQMDFYFENTATGGNFELSGEPATFSRGRCWSGNGFGPTHTAANTTFQVGDFKASAEYTITPTEGWYWIQCTIPEVWMAVLIIILVVIAVMCCCGCCGCVFCSRKSKH